jgi:hypothetical protein
MTDAERALRDAIIELAQMMVTHFDPRAIQALIAEMQKLDADTTEE